MKRLFITGSGTGVGKTFVTAALTRAAHRAGHEVCALKPVLSGFDPDRPEESDAGVLLDALGQRPTAENLDRISPWRFAAPLSPDMAAAREGRSIDFAALVQHGRSARGDLVLVEGVGGCMVPLDASRTVLDWIEALAFPVVIVGGSYLGTISHTLTALAAVQRVAQVEAVIVSQSPEQPVDLACTASAIGRFAGAVPVIALPRRSHLHHAPELGRLIA